MSWISAILYFLLFNILLRHPYVLVVVVLAYLLRDRIPSPAAYFRRQREFKRLRYDISVNPHDSTARRDIGMILLDKGRPKEALENLTDALRKEGDSSEINHLVGRAYLRSGMPSEAEGYLKKAIGIEPRLRYGESYLYLGETLLALGRPEEALDTLRTYLTINNTSIEGFYQYATALSKLGRKDEAKKAVEDGIRFHKANPGFRRRRDWRSYVKLKRLKGGL